MKKILLLIIFFPFLIECSKHNDAVFDENDPSVLFKNTIANGFYMGHFDYQSQSYWCEIEFNNNNYEEWPSGGALYQKEWSCLTKGTNAISDGILSFKLSSYKFISYPFPCEQVMILPGDYKIHLITENDSIIFSKGIEKNKIKYYLKKISP